MKLFHCTQCNQRVFFDNTHCDVCESSLGFVPSEGEMVAFSIDQSGEWNRLGSTGEAQRPCSNYVGGACNWTVTIGDPDLLCASCRTTKIIPSIAKPENQRYWTQLEQAKRRLFYTLMSLKLPVPSRDADLENGVSFQFLEEVSPKERVLTGHDEGVITLNIAEANDAHRERVRASMHEPYRTLLGHFRHEIGHYYWDRLITGTPWLDECRQLFGDERADYEAALKKHYAQPVSDWQANFISSYASSHP